MSLQAAIPVQTFLGYDGEGPDLLLRRVAHHGPLGALGSSLLRAPTSRVSTEANKESE